MDLTQLTNLGEFIGGVAVLVTLISLASRVRQNNTWNKQQGFRKHTGATLADHDRPEADS